MSQVSGTPGAAAFIIGRISLMIMSSSSLGSKPAAQRMRKQWTSQPSHSAWINQETAPMTSRSHASCICHVMQQIHSQHLLRVSSFRSDNCPRDSGVKCAALGTDYRQLPLLHDLPTDTCCQFNFCSGGHCPGICGPQHWHSAIAV